ncbi:MAG: hypothetical protein PUG16_02785 [Lachnospiraceae bacterium]|nr:hypothetical protein [Lachnospiraceae bacterium]
MKKRRITAASVYRLGLPLLFSVYILLCLITLSVLSLITSRQNLRNENLQKEAREAYFAAENQAEDRIKEIDEEVLTRIDMPLEETFTIPIDEKKTLEVGLKRTAEENRYRITEWKTIVSEYEGEDTVKGLTSGKEAD